MSQNMSSAAVVIGALRVKGGSVVVDFLFIVTPIVEFCNCSMFFSRTFLYVPSSFAIILMRKRESWLLCLVCLPSVS